VLTATLAALLAAALFAISAALQHRSAGLVREADAVGTASLGGFVSGTLRHPLWIAGSAAGIVGFAMHALALRYGPLTLVQPLLVSSAVFALALRQLLERRRPRHSDLGWALLLVVGLVLFLTIATPADGVTKPADALPTMVIGSIIGLGLLGFFVAGRRARGSAAAALLGTATGLSFAAKAGLLKQVVGTLDRGPTALATAWPVYVFIAVWLCSLLLNQLAYQAGPLQSSLPAIMAVDPIVSLVIGVAAFDEQFRSSPGDLAVEAFGLALVVVAAIRLTRSVPGPTYEPPDRVEGHPVAMSSPSAPGSLVAPGAQARKPATATITRPAS
jgi:hypothetical protein